MAEFVSTRENKAVNLTHIRCTAIETDVTVFLFHGAMGSSKQFSKILPDLQSKYNVCMYDALGCGDSEKPHVYSDYTSQSLCEDAVVVYRKYSTKHNIIVGHSFGTCIATWIAKEDAQSNASGSSIDGKFSRITAVILLGTALSAESVPIFNWPLLFLRCLSNVLASEGTKVLLSPTASEELKAEVLRANKANDMFVVKAFWSQFKWASSEDFLYLNHYPLMIIQSSDDVLTPTAKGKALFDFLQQNRTAASSSDGNMVFHEIQGSGHLMMLEQPVEISRLINGFIQKYV